MNLTGKGYSKFPFLRVDRTSEVQSPYPPRKRTCLKRQAHCSLQIAESSETSFRRVSRLRGAKSPFQSVPRSNATIVEHLECWNPLESNLLGQEWRGLRRE